MDTRTQITIANLQKNNMRTYYVEKKEDVVPLVKTLLSKGATVGSGGSMTLQECGVTDLLKSGYVNFIDRVAGASAEEIEKVYALQRQADFYFSSANAVTESGDLYNVDGRGNRVASIYHGPKQIVIVVGVNKIVKDLREAAYRVKTIAAPLNAVRLKYATPCAKTGKCISLQNLSGEATLNVPMTAGCATQDRICCDYSICGKQRVKDRMTIIVVGETLGY